jgi:hypothetical protein
MKHSILGVCALLALEAAPAFAVVVTDFAPFSANPAPGVWYKNDVRDAGTASVVALTGLGGDLETNQPLPIGAAKLTTEFANNDKAEVGLPNAFGAPGDILSTLNISYEYHKAANPGQNAFAAPSLKLTVFNQLCDDPASLNDCFGTLVYEPTWNQPSNPGASVAVPTDVWTAVSVDQNNGLFWWTGGFGQPNTAGGPPLRTLAQWAALFSSDFGDAQIVLVSVGVGTFNQGQIGYFDNVAISHSFGGGFAEVYDFEPPAPVPTVSEWGLVVLMLLGLTAGTIIFARKRVMLSHAAIR